MNSVGESSGGEYCFIKFFDVKICFVYNIVGVFFADSAFLIYHSYCIISTNYCTMNTIQKDLRQKILAFAYQAKTRHSHIGSCLSCIDILIQTFMYEMRKNDKFILSKGHAALALFVVLNYQKKISDKELETYMQNGTEFAIHTPSTMPDEIPLATGSLGHGLSFACGLAHGYTLQHMKNRRVFCLLSDGECNEGAIWEAALYANYHKLSNLVVLIDKNGFQAFGKTKDVLGDAASKEKWKAFGFNTYECDGHNLRKMEKVFTAIRLQKNKQPSVIICNTVRGKGVVSIEDQLISNYSTITEEMLKKYI